MKLPRYPQSLKELPMFCREVIDYLRASHINNVVNGMIKESPSGSTIVCGGNDSLGRKKGGTENAHPWKVTAGDIGFVNIAAGYIYSYYFTHTNPTWEEVNLSSGYLPPLSIVLAPGYEYAGGNTAITDTQYIYAIASTEEPVEVFAESGSYATSVNITYETELGQADPPSYATGAPYGVPTIEVSDDDPSVFIPASGAAVCIAKVSIIDDVVSITQYLTHNPTIFVPLIANPLADPN